MIVLRRYARIEVKGSQMTFFVDRCEQPWFNVLVHRLFHRIEPAITRFEKPIDRYLSRNDGEGIDEWALPWTVRVDLYCYLLGQKNLKVNGELEINETTWEALDVVD